MCGQIAHSTQPVPLKLSLHQLLNKGAKGGEKQTEREESRERENERDKQSRDEVSLIKTQTVSRINAVTRQSGINIMERGNSSERKKRAEQRVSGTIKVMSSCV